MPDNPTGDTPESTPKPKPVDATSSPTQTANPIEARLNLEIIRKINRLPSQTTGAESTVAQPKRPTQPPQQPAQAQPNPTQTNPFSQLAQDTRASECQSFVDLLNSPPGKPELDAMRFGEYVLTKRGNQRELTSGSGFTADEKKLINSDIYRTDAGAPLPGPFPGKFDKPPAYLSTAQRVFANTSADLGRNHNAILDSDLNQLMKANGIGPQEHVSLVNVDAHSDILEMGSSGGWADWVNKMLAKNPNITDFYWVTPNEFAQGDLKKRYFPDKEPKEVGIHLQNSGKDKTLFVGIDGTVLWNNVPYDYKAHPERYRIVQFHKRTLSEMPDMSGKKVVLSTDLDFFDNRGFDTLGNAKVSFKGDAGFKEYLDALDQKGVRPFFHFISASPEYNTKEHMLDLLRFAAYSIDSSKDKQPLNFTHHNDYRDSGYRSHGIEEPTQGNRGAEMVWRLFSNDLKTTQPDGRLVLDKANEERTAAIRTAMQLYKVNRTGALKILRNLDAADGTADGVIDFRLINNEAGKVCRDK
jgi:hypothetical protein